MLVRRRNSGEFARLGRGIALSAPSPSKIGRELSQNSSYTLRDYQSGTPCQADSRRSILVLDLPDLDASERVPVAAGVIVADEPQRPALVSDLKPSRSLVGVHGPDRFNVRLIRILIGQKGLSWSVIDDRGNHTIGLGTLCAQGD
jgi:hypothetical protein